MYLVTWKSNKRNWQKLQELKIHTETFVAFFTTNQPVFYSFQTHYSPPSFTLEYIPPVFAFSLFVKYLILESLKLKPYLPERLINTLLIYLQWCPRSDLKLYLTRLSLCWGKTVDQLLIHCLQCVQVQWHWISWFFCPEIHATDQAMRIQLPTTPLHSNIGAVTMNLTVCIKTLSLYFSGMKKTIHTLLIEINRGGVCSTTTITSNNFFNPKMECALRTWSFCFSNFLFPLCLQVSR